MTNMPYNPKSTTKKLEFQILKFLEDLGPFHYSVTINLKKRHPRFDVYSTYEQWEKSAGWLVSAINKKIFKRAYRYDHKKINSISAIEVGNINKRPHIHMALGFPTEVSCDQCMQSLIEVHRKMDWSYGEMHIEPYQDSGWIKYIMKEGFDRVALH